MERLNNNTLEAAKNLIGKSSPATNSSTSTRISGPTKPKIAAALSVINKYRIGRGWGAIAPDIAEETALVWIEQLDRYGIPAECYEALYRRTVDARVAKRQQGQPVADLTAEDLIASWTGANGLQAEMRAREIERGRTLTADAASQCPKCYGSGWEYVRENGRDIGVKGRCAHDGVR